MKYAVEWLQAKCFYRAGCAHLNSPFDHRRLAQLGSWVLLSASLLLLPQFALASDMHSLLQQSVKDYLTDLATERDADERRVEVTVGYIDPRIALPSCSRELDLNINGRQQPIGNVQVKVQCRGDVPWSKFVSAEVQVFELILVASENLGRGTILEDFDFRFDERDISSLRKTPVTRPADAIGKELKYSLTTGAPLALEGMKRPKVIRRGDQVLMVAESGVLQINQQGEAMQDGEVGKLINVRNSDSRRVIQAVVVSSGKVKIQL
jgi:flagella basal body P-ring formation protein FlgA